MEVDAFAAIRTVCELVSGVLAKPRSTARPVDVHVERVEGELAGREGSMQGFDRRAVRVIIAVLSVSEYWVRARKMKPAQFKAADRACLQCEERYQRS